jgi:hypothetical protein
MPKQKNLSIIKQNHELLKIIPMGNEDEVEFKMIIRANINHFCYSCNYMFVRSVDSIAYRSTFFKDDPKAFKDNTAEYSYHRTKDKKTVKIHLKVSYNGQLRYITPEFNNLIEPNTTQILPIPLCKISCHDPMIFPEFHSKNTNVPCDISEEIEHNILEHNVVEIYMLGNHCNDLRVYLQKKWGFLYLIASMFSIEHFAVPNIDHIMVKSDGMEKSNIMQYLSFSLNEHVSFWICTYYSEKVATNPDETNFSLIENGDYLKVIACTPVQYVDTITGMRSEKKFAYEWQLLENKKLLTPIEYSFWEKRFKRYAKEYKKKNIRLPGLLLQTNKFIK